MKKFLSLILFLSISTAAFCQYPTFTFGIRSGVNSTKYHRTLESDYGFLSDNYEKAALFTSSLSSEINFSKHFALRTEINLIQKGYKTQYYNVDKNSTDSESGNSKFVTNWIEIPLLAKVAFGKQTGLRLGLFCGPSLGYALNGHYNFSHTSTLNGVFSGYSIKGAVDFEYFNHKRYDVGLNYGGDISYKRLFLDIRYQSSLKNLAIRTSGNEEQNININTQSFMLTMGYRTPIFSKTKGAFKYNFWREIFH
jgi:hypothetical protein